jgi:hypothetical protein
MSDNQPKTPEQPLEVNRTIEMTGQNSEQSTDQRHEEPSPNTSELALSGTTPSSELPSSNQQGSACVTETTCSICYEEYNIKTTAQPCSHSFCLACIRKWVTEMANQEAQCAFCRTPITELHYTKPQDGQVTVEVITSAVRSALNALSATVRDHILGAVLDSLIFQDFSTIEESQEACWAYMAFENTIFNHRSWELQDGLWFLRTAEGHEGQTGDAHPFSNALTSVFQITLPLAIRIENATNEPNAATPVPTATLPAILDRVERRTSEMASNLNRWYND